jgi:hypothetical protein
MHSTLTPKPSDDPHDVVVVTPDAVRVAPSDDELSNLLHQAARYRSDTQTHTASDVPAGPPIPPVDTTFRPAAANDVEVLGDRRSIGSRVVRAFTALLLAGCIGAAAIAWQASGDLAKKLITKWAPQFVLTSLLSPEKPGLSAQPAPPAIQAGAAEAAPPQPAPLAQTAPEGVAPTAAVLSPESASMARDLATVGQEIEQLKATIEQLKASQQQMSREIAKASEQNKASENQASELNKASEQNLRAKTAAISASPPHSAAARARKPMPPFPPPQAAAAPTLPQTAAPYLSRQVEPEPQATAQPQADPELASVPRPPMPIRPSIGSFTPQ